MFTELLKTAIDIYLISTLKPENTCSFHPVFPADQIWPACCDEGHFPDQWNESNWAWQFINLAAPFIVEPLTYTINLSFEPSEVPQDIQISSMMAWYKKKGSKIFPSKIKNYLWFRRFVRKLVQEISICCGVPSRILCTVYLGQYYLLMVPTWLSNTKNWIWFLRRLMSISTTFSNGAIATSSHLMWKKPTHTNKELIPYELCNPIQLWPNKPRIC